MPLGQLSTNLTTNFTQVVLEGNRPRCYSFFNPASLPRGSLPKTGTEILEIEMPSMRRGLDLQLRLHYFPENLIPWIYPSHPGAWGVDPDTKTRTALLGLLDDPR